jgi:N-glycosylase/DNA lyase
MSRARNGPPAILPGLAGANLEVTLFGGQAFRWRRSAGGYVGWVGDRPVSARPAAEGLAVQPLDGGGSLEAAAARYFDAGRDYAAIERDLFRDARLRDVAAGISGIRILRQPPFETIVSFVTSANNNIARITRTVEALARMAGEPVETDEGVMWRFPSPDALAGLDLARLRGEANLGYRDRYVAETARLVASGAADVSALERLPTPELREALLALPGVGVKVADCIALYGFGRIEVFPVDTWVRRAVLELYLGPGERATDRELAELARARFGEYAGVAQQYLFEAFRRRQGSLGSKQ